jgi:uncharacterized membrane protein YhaH (DUF805 family)
MSEEKPERLGLRGRLAHLESTLRLLGGANATGAIAAGAAFHAFDKNMDVQNAVKVAAVLFLFGIFTFAVAYASLFMATHDIDHSLHKEGEATWPEFLFWVPTKSPEQYKKQAKWEFIVAMLSGLASFVFFFVGLYFR